MEVLWLLPPTNGVELPVNLLSFPQPGVCSREDVIRGERRREKQSG